MNYEEKQYDDIFLSMLQDAFKERLVSNDEKFLDYIANKQDISNFYVMLLAIHSEAIADVYKQMTKVYNSSKVQYAESNDLDSLGLIVDCSRPQATKASVILQFKTTKDDLRKISKGVVVSTRNGISYRTVEDIEFTEDNNVCEVTALATIAGIKSRVDENKLVITSQADVTVTNPNPSTGGSEAYTDEQYRELLMNWVKTKEKGNLWAYKNYFARLDGISDYKIVPNWNGSGTIKVIVSPATPYILNTVYNGLSENVVQATEDITLTAPKDIEVDIYVKCNVDIDRLNPYSTDDKTFIQEKIAKAVEDYIDSMGIGEDFIPHKLAVAVDKSVSELKNIDFNYPTEVITVDDEEKCVVGNVQIDME